MARRSNPVRGKRFSLLLDVQTCYAARPASYSVGTGVLVQGTATGFDLITQIHPAPRLRISGDIPPLSLSAFMAWTGMLSFLPVILRRITKSTYRRTTSNVLMIVNNE